MQYPERDIVADLDGDGRADRVVLRLEENKVVLEVTIASRKTPATYIFPSTDFACSPVQWQAQCGDKQGAMKAEAIDADFRKDFSSMFDLGAGHLASNKHAQAVFVPLGDTDPIWLYWDPAIDGVAWARL